MAIHPKWKSLPQLLTFLLLLFSICVQGQVKKDEVDTIIRDKDGNIYLVITMPDNKKWLQSNLNTNIPQSFCYQNEEKNCKEYGRLYTWKSAQEGCRLLGDGWRLPSNEEWQQLGRAFGGVVEDSKDSGHAAFRALIKDGKPGFNIVYGGRCDSIGTNSSHGDAHGFYWTSTATEPNYAWFYNFGKNGKMMNHHSDGEKSMAISVRCVKDGGMPKKQ